MMTGAAIVECVVTAIERQHTVDATAIFVPRSVALRLQHDALPVPLVKIGGGGQRGGADAFAGVENIQRVMRFVAGGRGAFCDAKEEIINAINLHQPRVLHALQPQLGGGEQAFRVARIKSLHCIRPVDGGAPATIFRGHIAGEVAPLAVRAALEDALLD